MSDSKQAKKLNDKGSNSLRSASNAEALAAVRLFPFHDAILLEVCLDMYPVSTQKFNDVVLILHRYVNV